VKFHPILLAIIAAAFSCIQAEETDQATELAKKLSNPVANLISVPLQANWDYGIGRNDASRFTLNIQPVVPLSISADANLIVRTILPIIDAESPAPGIHGASGLGDITQSFFYSPKNPTSGGWIWGAGPVFLWPSATDSLLGTGKWGVGPTAVLLKQEGGWTVGILANHIWSYAGSDSRTDVNSTFLQPFLSYTTKTHTTITLNTETTRDWENDQWTVPINLLVAQLFKIGEQPMQFGVGGRYYVAKPQGGPDWGLRAVLTFLFPK
jgi:hypothetical protein